MRCGQRQLLPFPIFQIVFTLPGQFENLISNCRFAICLITVKSNSPPVNNFSARLLSVPNKPKLKQIRKEKPGEKICRGLKRGAAGKGTIKTLFPRAIKNKSSDLGLSFAKLDKR